MNKMIQMACSDERIIASARRQPGRRFAPLWL